MFLETMPDDVTWFSSSQQGAQQMMGGSNGDMLKVLDACLIDGYNELPALSITKDDDTTTITFNSTHGYLNNQKIVITGADDPLLNGEHRVKNQTTTTITLYTPAVTSVAGTIIVKIAALGWESIFGSTDPLKRAYRSRSVSSGKRVLFLDMSYPNAGEYHATAPARRAMVSVCQDMQIMGEKIGDMTSTINNVETHANGTLFWQQKRASAKTALVPNTPSSWLIIGNKDFFYFLVGWGVGVQDSTVHRDVFAFGEYVGLDPSIQEDKTFLSAYASNNDATSANIGSRGGWVSSFDEAKMGVYISTTGQMEFKPLSVVCVTANTILTSGGGSIAFPSPIGSNLFTMPMRIAHSTSNTIHGFMPSMLFIENSIAISSYDSNFVDGVLLAHVQKQPATSLTTAYYGFHLG